MFELILKIILAHLLGDFVFQSDKMVEDIESKTTTLSCYKVWGKLYITCNYTINISFGYRYIHKNSNQK